MSPNCARLVFGDAYAPIVASDFGRPYDLHLKPKQPSRARFHYEQPRE
jgi:hypothetical protein